MNRRYREATVSGDAIEKEARTQVEAMHYSPRPQQGWEPEEAATTLPPVHDAVNCLQRQVSEMGTILHGLHERLSPILHPMLNQPPSSPAVANWQDSRPEPAEDICDLAHKLFSIGGDLQGLLRQADDILQRVQV